MKEININNMSSGIKANTSNLQNKFQEILSKKWSAIAFFIGLFIVTVGGSWLLFSFIIKTPQPGVSSKNVGTVRSKINPNLPKTESCPLNGEMYTKDERTIWEGRRPATLMVENHVDSRPPEGLSRADIIYEAVAEGGITRFLAVFYCGAAAGDIKVAPVRSSRVYFINWASEYGDRPLYVHVGGANDFGPNGESKPAGEIDPEVDALGLLQTIGWRVPGGNDYDAAYDAGYPIFYRDPERLGHPIPTEHTMTVSTDALYQDAESRGLAAKAKDGILWTKGFTPYTFVDGAKAANTNATNISFEFWSNQPDYNVMWKYDPQNNNYLRSDGGKPHTDLDYDNVQLSAKNIVVMQVAERGPVDSELHMFYQTVGTGNVQIFQNGTVINGTWTKSSRTARTIFEDEKGKEIPLVKGVTWIEAIPAGNTVTFN